MEGGGVDRAPQTRRAEASAEPAPRRRSPRTQHGVVAVDEPPTPSLADGRDDILGAAAGLSRIAPGVVPVPVRAVEGSRIQRRIVDGPDQPTSEFDVQRIRLAISELPDAQAASRVLQPLLDDDVDHPVGDVLAQFGLDAGVLPSAAQLVASGAPRPGLDISKTIRFNDDPSVIAFTRLATAVDGQEDHKLAKFVALVEKRLQAAPAEQGARTIGPVYVRGYRSEDEPARIATTRAAEVARRLKESGLSVDVAVVGMTRGIKGNFNYREMRRVELRCADEVDLSEHTPEPEDSPAAGDGRVLGSDARYAAYGVLDALQAGERLIDVALSKLATISVATPADDAVMKIFRQFFHSADPNVVAGNLRFARKQIPLYVPEAPADPSRPEGGHACLDESRPGILFLNQGVGPTARMIAGVDSLHATPGNRAYNIVHEATHGAPEVQTVDVAYQWQRLFHFLSPADQLRNADSYGMLVGTLARKSKPRRTYRQSPRPGESPASGSQRSSRVPSRAPGPGWSTTRHRSGSTSVTSTRRSPPGTHCRRGRTRPSSTGPCGGTSASVPVPLSGRRSPASSIGWTTSRPSPTRFSRPSASTWANPTTRTTRFRSTSRKTSRRTCQPCGSSCGA
jgi:hypothetical protein